jgi:hypothetical protein
MAASAGLTWGVAMTRSLKENLRRRLAGFAGTFSVRTGGCKT